MTNTVKTITPPKKRAANIPTDKLCTFEGHPFKVLDDEDMDNLTESIRTQGIISPLIVRPIENTDKYEVISGHRRLYAAIKAGLTEVFAIKSDTAAEIGKEQGESRDKVFRYIRLTNLIPELLQKVDEGTRANVFINTMQKKMQSAIKL